jgi:poly-gamma-glutamate synthesis protein (capsule biosynthesis protein)
MIFSLSLCACKGSEKPSETTVSDTTVPDTTVPDTTAPDTTPEQTTTEEITTEPPVTTQTVTLLAVGDNLIHAPLLNSAKNFGYEKFYARIKDTISTADIAIINQESCFTYNSSIYSGYPKFATPTAFGEAAIDAGFDVFTLATNHTWDHGEQPIIDTLDFFAKHPEVTALGIHDSVDSYYKTKVIEKNGIKIAIYNCSYGSNRPNSVWWRMNDMNDKDYYRQMLAWAEKNADITIVIPHWGTEYQYTPNSKQISWAKFFTECGADIIIGHHPHAVQPMMTVTASNGNTSICYYSLGNFISNQSTMKGNVGGMASLTIVKENGNTRVEDATMIPITVQCEKVTSYSTFEAMLLSDLTPEMLKRSSKFKDNTVEEFWALFNMASTSYP